MGSKPIRAVIETPKEIKAARKWFNDHFDSEQPAGSFAKRDDKQTGLLYIPPVSQETLNAIVVFIGTAIEQERKEQP